MLLHKLCCFLYVSCCLSFFLSCSLVLLLSLNLWCISSRYRRADRQQFFCRISSLLQGSFAKETYNFKEPTNRSLPYSATHSKLAHYNTLPYTATHCNTLKHAATHCNTLKLQHTETATHVGACWHSADSRQATALLQDQHAATHHTTLQPTAAHFNTLQHTATNCNTHRCPLAKYRHATALWRQYL